MPQNAPMSMGGLLGRETELATLETALKNTRTTNVAGAFRISGAPGIGKTALLAAGIERAREAGWLVARVDVHRIQGALPLVAARRLTRSILEALGQDAERYAGGLAVIATDAPDADPAAVREGIVRLVEGVLHDFPVLLAVDDAQWIDPESRTLVDELLHSFADRAIALFAAERADERSSFDEISDTLLLGPVSEDASAKLVLALYPDAPMDVVGSILKHAQGRPVEIVALARAARDAQVRDAEGVHASVRTAVAGELNHGPAPLREFLQLCSLIAEPIDYGTLLRIWPDDAVAQHITEASGKYLVQDGTGLRFVHSTIAESVRQTMPVEIPYRRKIIAALAAIDAPTLEEYERIIQQALACGDKALAHRYLLELAAQAARESALFTASDAYERAFGIGTPKRDEMVSVYLEYASLLHMQTRSTEAAAVLRRALADTTAYKITEGVGAIAALFLVAQWMSKGHAAALEAYEPLARRFSAGDDRAQLLSVAAWLYACADDRDRFQRCKDELLESGAETHELRMRLNVAEAHLAIRRGETAVATSAMEAAVAEAGSVPSANRRTAEVSRALVHFKRIGPRGIDATLPTLRIQRSADQTQFPLLQYLRALNAFARGDFEDVRELLHDALARPMDRHNRQWLLGIGAALGALTKMPTQHDHEIDNELTDFSGTPEDQWVAPLASWRALTLCETNPADARTIVQSVLQMLETPPDISTFNFPLPLALTAARLMDRPLLERIGDMTGIWEDRAPWMVAQRKLAMGYARKVLNRTDAAHLLYEASQMFVQFDSPLFVAIAQVAGDDAAGEGAAFLNARGIGIDLLPNQKSGAQTPGEARRKGTAVPSRRELEIIALVADGQTNKAIAQSLFLSERTVEGHIANVFNKLNVSSRTQVAAWYLTAQTNGHHPPRAQDRTPRQPV